MAIGKEEKNLILGGAVLAVAYFAILKPVTDKLGLTQTQKDKAEAELNEEASNNSGWNPNFWKDYQKRTSQIVMLKRDAATTAIAKKIYDAWGLFSDNDQAINSAIRQLRSQVQLSQVVAKYAELYNQDLLTRLKAPWWYLKDGLTTEQFAAVSRIVTALPINVSN